LDSQLDFNGLRNAVCEYYKSFNKTGNYPEKSIKYNLQMQMIADDEEDDGTLHQNKICYDLEWGGIMDVIALTDILKINIVTMIMRKEGYTVQPFVYKENAKTIFIKYNGKDHFEPLLPKFDVKSPTPRASLSHSSRYVKSPTPRASLSHSSKKHSAKNKSSSSKNFLLLHSMRYMQDSIHAIRWAMLADWKYSLSSTS
jgi:hypothetical protein